MERNLLQHGFLLLKDFMLWLNGFTSSVKSAEDPASQELMFIGTDLAMDGLHIPAVTMADVKH